MSRILVVAPAWLGDMAMTQSLVAVLKRNEPDAEIDLLAPPWTAGLGARMPGVRRTIAIDLAHGRFDFAKRRAVGRSLRAERYDRAIVLPNSWKSALVPWAARIPKRTGYLGEMRYGLVNDPRHLDKAKLVRFVDRFVALADVAGAPLPEVPFPVLNHDAANGRATAERLNLVSDRPVIALCPGAEYGPAKRWPAAHFAELAEKLAKAGYRTWIFGSGKDVAIGESIRALARAEDAAPINLAGKTDLAAAIDLMALTVGVVTNDTGLMHLAAAIGRPLVAIFGSSTATRSPPLSTRATVVDRDLDCRPCMKRECPLGHLNCLKLIPASEVAERILAVAETLVES